MLRRQTSRIIKSLGGSTVTATLLALVLLLFSLFLMNSVIAGKDYLGLITDPSKSYVKLDPGSEYSGVIKLTHDFQTKGEVTFYPFVTVFDQVGETGSSQIDLDYIFKGEEPDSYSFDAVQWVTFAEESYILNYGDTVESHFTIKVPETAEPGGYYIALVYSEIALIDQNKSNVSLGQGNSSLLFLTISGDIVEDGELVEFYTFSEKTGDHVKTDNFEFAPVNFSIRYKNTGNVHTQVGGDIFIHQGDLSSPIATLKVNDEIGYTLPDRIRDYNENWTAGWLTLENGKIVFHKDVFGKILFGKYTATLMLRSTVDGERVTTTKDIDFYVYPWKLILIVTAGLLGVLAWGVGVFKLKDMENSAIRKMVNEKAMNKKLDEIREKKTAKA